MSVRFVQYACYTFGVLTLLSSATLIAQRELDSRRLLNAAEARTAASQQNSVIGEPARPAFTWFDTPDQTYWSDSRKDAYVADVADTELLGALAIPTLALEAPILKGIEEASLNRGLGWLDKTSTPGSPGNFAVAGHRDSFFRRLGQIERGQEVIVTTPMATFTYEVETTRIVDPADVSVLDSVPGRSLLTLITCYPFYYVGPAPKRFIVHATLVATDSPGPR